MSHIWLLIYYLAQAAPFEAEVGAQVDLGVGDGVEVSAHHEPVVGWQVLGSGDIVWVVGVLAHQHHRHADWDPL